MQPPINVLRLALHPDGLAPRTRNLAEWRSHLLSRLRRQIDVSADPVLIRLLRELRDYPAPTATHTDPDPFTLAAPVRLLTDAGEFTFFSPITVFGTPVDITLSELALEAFYPANAATAEGLRRLAE